MGVVGERESGFEGIKLCDSRGLNQFSLRCDAFLGLASFARQKVHCPMAYVEFDCNNTTTL
jgi:hypothetical protein